MQARNVPKALGIGGGDATLFGDDAVDAPELRKTHGRLVAGHAEIIPGDLMAKPGSREPQIAQEA